MTGNFVSRRSTILFGACGNSRHISRAARHSNWRAALREKMEA
jgi:hypothetical protein